MAVVRTSHPERCLSLPLPEAGTVLDHTSCPSAPAPGCQSAGASRPLSAGQPGAPPLAPARPPLPVLQSDSSFCLESFAFSQSTWLLPTCKALLALFPLPEMPSLPHAPKSQHSPSHPHPSFKASLPLEIIPRPFHPLMDPTTTDLLRRFVWLPESLQHLFFIFLATPDSRRDFRSPTGDQSCVPCGGSMVPAFA